MSELLYEKIYKDIKKMILDGTYPIGERLPTDSELTKIYSVSLITIKRAMDLLKDDQLISRKPRKGTTVIDNEISQNTPPNSEDKLPLIGLIFTDFNDVFGTNILRSLVKASFGKVQLIFKISGGDSEMESKLLDEFIELGVDGIMLIPASSKYISPKLLSLVSQEFPLVLIDRIMEKIPTCSVQTDNFNAAQHLTEHLFENGHKRIGLITASTNITTIEERIDGTITAHVNNHVPINQSQILPNLKSMIPNSNTKPQEDVNKIIDFIKREKDLTAIITGEYTIALLAKQAIEEMGKEVYKDISVVCFDHPENNRIDKDGFVFTHILQDQSFIGEKSLELILKKIENPSYIKKVDAPFSLIRGMSVRTRKIRK